MSTAVTAVIEATYKQDQATALEHLNAMDTSALTDAQKLSRNNAITALQQPNFGEARAWLSLM